MSRVSSSIRAQPKQALHSYPNTASLVTLSHRFVSYYSEFLYEFEILRELHSESASLLFARCVETDERVVIKILRKYHDNRYSLETVSKRQLCQLEALRCNRLFSPGIYIGLARISKRNTTSIYITEIIDNPTKKTLNPNAEYGLLMFELPKDRRLDILLKGESEVNQRQHVQLVAQYLGYMHTKLASPPNLGTDNQQWGSFRQIQNKLEHNLALLELALVSSEYGQYRPTLWVKDNLGQLFHRSWQTRHLEQYFKSEQNDRSTLDRLRDVFFRLKTNIYQVFRPDPYEQFFEQRRHKQCIKHCHGDLKAPHIWIAPYPWPNSEPWKYISVLDAIDFNPMYSNIDILSDLAMLVVDIQASTKSPEFAQLLVKDYLYLTNQQDEVSKAVLAYYLVEKAVMWAAVSIVYDNLPEWGLAFLEVAEKRMNELAWNDLISGAITLLTIPFIGADMASHSNWNQSG